MTHEDEIIAKYFAELTYLIEATSNEIGMIYKENSEQWDEYLQVRSIGRNVGSLDGRPVIISIQFVRFYDQLVALWHATSVIVDYDMITDWFKKQSPQLFPESGVHQSTDAQHAYHAIRHCEQKSKERPKPVTQVSFDVWNTLVNSNATFARARDQKLAAIVNMPIEITRPVYVATKKAIDQAAEYAGRGLNSTEVYELLRVNLSAAALLQGGYPSVTNAQMLEFRAAVEHLFGTFEPILRPGVRVLINYLKKDGYKITIASNSNFISGELMNKYLADVLGIDDLRGVYSDLAGYSKPATAFFEDVVDLYEVDAENILHVGDNSVCDVKGARDAGLQALHLESTDDIYGVVTSYLVKAG